MDVNTPYNASLTREPFMFHEMKVTASLLNRGLSDEEAIEKIVTENLFQYPTERSLKQRSRGCVRRLRYLDDELISWIDTRSLDVAKQVCLYALMKDSRLVYEFMLTVIGKQYETKDFSYSREAITVFFMRLQEQSEQVAGWSEVTIKKLISVLSGLLKDTGYIDGPNAKRLNEMLIDHKLKEKIVENGDRNMLPAYNYFEVEA
mgnify:CR=1 FL=1